MFCHNISKGIAGLFNYKHIKYKSGSSEKLRINEYLENIRPYLRHMLDTLQNILSMENSLYNENELRVNNRFP